MIKSTFTALFIAMLGMICFAACKKTTTTTPTQTTPAAQTACNGMNLCFKMDGTEESHDAKWLKIGANATNPDRYRIYWEEGTGNSYKNIELDVFASATGTYNVNNNSPHVANDASFQYFSAGGTNIEGTSGTVTITSIDNNNNTISGTFTITATDGSNTIEITDGNFVNVPL